MMNRPVMIGLLVLAGVSLLGAGPAHPQERPSQAAPAMTVGTLQGILKETVENLKRDNRQWRLTFGGAEMALLTSAPHDRMRIIAPIGPEAQLTDSRRKRMLEANFHAALDVRYATSNGLVYAAYIHPLAPLRREEIHRRCDRWRNLSKHSEPPTPAGELSCGSPSPPPKSDRQKEPYC